MSVPSDVEVETSKETSCYGIALVGPYVEVACGSGRKILAISIRNGMDSDSTESAVVSTVVGVTGMVEGWDPKTADATCAPEEAPYSKTNVSHIKCGKAPDCRMDIILPTDLSCKSHNWTPDVWSVQRPHVNSC